MTDYTPTTRDVRDDYREARIMGDRDPDAEFDRWLEQVKAEAWEEGYVDGASDEIIRASIDRGTRTQATNPYRQKEQDT